jgi:hypothetical protein
MSVQDRIHNRIKRKGRGTVFTPKDFLDLGSRAAVDQSLSRMARAGTIRRLDRGVYDFPQTHPRFGALSPSSDAVAKAVAGGCAVQPSGAQAANSLGLSTQVPARTVYYTDGPQRNVRVGRGRIQVRRRSPRDTVGAGTDAGRLYQALRYVGRKRVSDDVIDALRRRVPADVRRQLHADLKKNPHVAPDWILAVSKRLVDDP